MDICCECQSMGVCECGKIHDCISPIEAVEETNDFPCERKRYDDHIYIRSISACNPLDLTKSKPFCTVEVCFGGCPAKCREGPYHDSFVGFSSCPPVSCFLNERECSLFGGCVHVPHNTNIARVTLIAGGAGGGNGGNGGINSPSLLGGNGGGGGSGSSGDEVVFYMKVVPCEVYIIHIGEGGLAGQDGDDTYITKLSKCCDHTITEIARASGGIAGQNGVSGTNAGLTFGLGGSGGNGGDPSGFGSKPGNGGNGGLNGDFLTSSATGGQGGNAFNQTGTSGTVTFIPSGAISAKVKFGRGGGGGQGGSPNQSGEVGLPGDRGRACIEF